MSNPGQEASMDKLLTLAASALVTAALTVVVTSGHAQGYEEHEEEQASLHGRLLETDKTALPRVAPPAIQRPCTGAPGVRAGDRYHLLVASGPEVPAHSAAPHAHTDSASASSLQQSTILVDGLNHGKTAHIRSVTPICAPAHRRVNPSFGLFLYPFSRRGMTPPHRLDHGVQGFPFVREALNAEPLLPAGTLSSHHPCAVEPKASSRLSAVALCISWALLRHGEAAFPLGQTPPGADDPRASAPTEPRLSRSSTQTCSPPDQECERLGHRWRSSASRTPRRYHT